MTCFGQDWSKLDFVVGKWTGVAAENDTPLGAGQGGFSFELDLDKKVIVRKNHAEYDKGVKHDDLMVIYMEGAPRATRSAITWRFLARTKSCLNPMAPSQGQSTVCPTGWKRPC